MSPARWRRWARVLVALAVVAALALLVVASAGCRAVTVYAETQATNFSGPKGGNVRSSDAEGYTFGVALNLGALMDPRPQPVYFVGPPGSYEAPAFPPAKVIPVPAWLDPHKPAHDLPPETARCRQCGRTREDLAGETDGEAG